MMPKTRSTLLSPRLVTVMVASLISELRSDPARARWVTSRNAAITLSTLFASAS